MSCFAHGIYHCYEDRNGHSSSCASTLCINKKRLCADMGLLHFMWDDMLLFHGDDMIMWPLASSFYMITVQEHEWITQNFVEYHCTYTIAWVPRIFYIIWWLLPVVRDNIWAKMPWLQQFLVLWAQMMDCAIIFDNRSVSSTDAVFDSNVGYVNNQYQISDFLEIVSIDIFGHGGAMNIILPKNLF